jgi:hypothetical protein
MVTTWLRILVGLIVAAALLGLGVLEIITARPRGDHLIGGVGNRGDDRPGPWLDFQEDKR